MSLLDPQRGFDRGFDVYDMESLESDPQILGHRYYRSHRETLHKLFRWIDLGERPFLAWVHHFGIHKLEDELVDLPDQYRNNYSEYAQFYDGKVSYTDAAFLAPLVNGLVERELLDETILVLWSDHGEDLRAQDGGLHWGHNNDLSEAVMRILLALRIPGQTTSSPRFDDRLCGSIDILPSVLESIGIDCPPGVEGRSVLQVTKQHDCAVYMENLCQGHVGVRFGDYKLVLSLPDRQRRKRAIQRRLGWRAQLIADTFQQLLPSRWRKARLRSLRKGDAPLSPDRAELAPWWRARGEPEQVLFELLERGVPRLCNITQDPRGERDLALSHPCLKTQGMELIREMNDTGQSPIPQDVLTASEETTLAKRLEYLGYL